jgi:hypothetical protein
MKENGTQDYFQGIFNVIGQIDQGQTQQGDWTMST